MDAVLELLDKVTGFEQMVAFYIFSFLTIFSFSRDLCFLGVRRFVWSESLNCPQQKSEWHEASTQV